MNKRQRKKLRKKYYHKKYRIVNIAQFVYNEKTETTDMILCYIHNGSNKLVKACAYTNIRPSSAKLISEPVKEEEIKINFISF